MGKGDDGRTCTDSRRNRVGLNGKTVDFQDDFEWITIRVLNCGLESECARLGRVADHGVLGTIDVGWMIARLAVQRDAVTERTAGDKLCIVERNAEATRITGSIGDIQGHANRGRLADAERRRESDDRIRHSDTAGRFGNQNQVLDGDTGEILHLKGPGWIAGGGITFHFLLGDHTAALGKIEAFGNHATLLEELRVCRDAEAEVGGRGPWSEWRAGGQTRMTAPRASWI